MDLLSTYLADRDTPCPGCGYNLRGLTGERCPECNQELALRVGLVEPRMRLYLVALIGAAAGLGFSGLMFLYVLNAGARYFTGWAAAYLGAGALVHGVLVWLLLAQGVWIRRRGLWVRLPLGLGMWGLSLVNLLMFANTDRWW